MIQRIRAVAVQVFFRIKSMTLPLLAIAALTLASPPSNAQIAPGDLRAVPVEFMFFHELAAKDSGVGVNGTMNGWGDVLKLREVEPGLWKRKLELLPAAYAYKFVTYTDTVGQTGVTGWFTDPLNPEFGGPYNDSYLFVKDPMVYYLLPRDGLVISETQPRLSAEIGFANASALDLDRLQVTIDGVPLVNAADYYDPASREWDYFPEAPLTFARHTVWMKVFNTAGDSAEALTTFEVTNLIVAAPHTFIFDSKSPSFEFIGEVQSVDVKGTFNFEGLNALQDGDGDGVYDLTTSLLVSHEEEYTMIVNGGSYLNDPDNPNLSRNHRTRIIKAIDPRPRFFAFDPPPGRIYSSPDATMTIRARIAPSDSAYIIDETTLAATLDGVALPLSSAPTAEGFEVTLEIASPVDGRHVLELFAADLRGNPAWPATYAFGVYPDDSGVHYADGEDDDKGTGTYRYPVNVPVGSADLREVHVRASPSLDSLEVVIELDTLSDFTRLGLVLVNSLDAPRLEAPQQIELLIPDWDDRGAFAILASPTSKTLLPTIDNNMFVSRDPVEARIRLVMDATAATVNRLHFRVPLAELEGVMGSFTGTWYLGVYSFLRTATGVVEVVQALGGENLNENPDVYDVAFFAQQANQERLLRNYIPPTRTGGTRLAVIATSERGFLAITPTAVDPRFDEVRRPRVALFASGGQVLQREVNVVGQVTDQQGAPVTLKINNSEVQVQSDATGRFSATVSLNEGKNKIVAEVREGGSAISRSHSITYDYVVDHLPEVSIVTSVTSEVVTMDASASRDPDGTTLRFNWKPDAGNPASVSLSNPSAAVVTFPAPQTPGEYYFTATAIDGSQQSGWARTVVLVDSAGVHAPDYATWHPAWVDSAIVYEVFVRTFSPSGSFRSITARLQEIKDLGVNCIWFMPIHPTTGNLGPDNPGYAITDYLEILTNYGTKADFSELVQKAHALGMRVVLDHVIQHTSALHPFLVDADKYKNDSPYYPFYMWDENNNFQYLFTWVDLPSINFEEERTRQYLLRMARYWVQAFELDGYRCDVAWAINDLRPSGPAYWQQWRRELKAMKPDILLLAEANALENFNYFDGKFDSAYDWPWFGALRDVLTGSGSIANLDQVTNTYQHPPFPQHALPFRFLENHDERRFFEAFGLARTKAAAAVLLTAPGIPMIYAGQEVGELTHRGVINWSDPNGLRPYYQNLTRIRRRNPALMLGDFERLNNNASTEVYSYLRTHQNNSVIVNVRFTEAPAAFTVSVPLEKTPYDSTDTFYLNDELNGESYQVTGSQLRNYDLELDEHNAQVLVLADEPLTDVELRGGGVPLQFQLSQNFPNPFNPTTVISYVVGGSQPVPAQLHLFNLLGQRVRTLVDETSAPGSYTIVWDGKDESGRQLATGIYFYRFEAGNFRAIRKMLLVK